jgi:2-dehydro-3-deoxyphosphogluconate aldolase/(4S)-4-hydroxy-2-oxoglutarate aldolase
MQKPSFDTSGLAFKSRVVPVITLTHAQQAVPLAHALLAGGIDVMEITLRHSTALSSIEAVARSVPGMQVGAGTVTHAYQVSQIRDAGATFALSPGLTPAIHEAVKEHAMPFIPGAMTPSEVMQAWDWGYQTVKLFPAAQAGGIAMLKAMAGPLGEMRFCPTGGVSLSNLADYLKQPNVSMVGGSWMVPLNLIESAQWMEVKRLAAEASAVAQSTVQHPG